jgi:hypothetical protein
VSRHYSGYWLFRCPAQSTFPAVAHGKGVGKGVGLEFISIFSGTAFAKRHVLRDNNRV